MNDKAQSLPHALSGDRRELEARAGRLSYYVAGEGAPLLLVHSINAAASAYEMRPIYEWARQHRRVYAVDLPGFGYSDRSARRYEVPLYVAAVQDMLGLIAAESGDAPLDAVALSLACEFLAKAAVAAPERLRSLVMINPTGLNRGSERLRGPSGSTREIPGMYGFFSLPLWGPSLYRLLTSRSSIRYFLSRTYGSKQVDPDMVEYDYLTARRPGAANAPFAFLSGRLFSRDIRDVYERLTLPIWVPHGIRGDFKDFSGAEWTRQRANWTLQAFDSGALPHFEREAEFLGDLDRFLSAVDEQGAPATAVAAGGPRVS